MKNHQFDLTNQTVPYHELLVPSALHLLAVKVALHVPAVAHEGKSGCTETCSRNKHQRSLWNLCAVYAGLYCTTLLH